MAQPLSPALRRLGMGVLAAAYVLQTGAIWADPSPQEPMTGPALDGARIWHEQNCQACHQLYGYGGFLGPDLTNAATVHGPEGLRVRLAQVLETGPGAMPVIAASADEVEALAAWLEVLDDSGIGQARAPERGSRAVRFEDAVSGLLVAGSAAQEGHALWLRLPCQGCHQPLTEAPGGPPDLSLAAARLGPEGLAEVLDAGRPPRMPAPGLDPAEQASLHAWLSWLGQERSAVAEAVDGGVTLAWADVPWWEFE